MFKKTIKMRDGQAVLLREPKPGDARQMMEMINEMAAEPDISIVAAKRVTLKEEKAWLKGVLAAIKKKQKVMLLIESKGKIRGNSSIELRRPGTKEAHNGVFGITIGKELRGKGIAQQLIPVLVDLAKKRLKGLEIIELEVFATNKTARYVYEKLGWKKVAVIPNKVKTSSGKHIDSIVMQKYVKKIKP
jgi:RimJ/RimL family protein N-acetyltransferase